MSKYEVGYGKPPTKTQFKKGASGNPKGRPKGSQNPSELMSRLLWKSVTITQNGKPIKVPFIEALMTKILAMAASGDHKAIKLAWEAYKECAQSTQARSIADVMAGHPSFELTAEELASISKSKLLKGVS
jgi:Family of unknown function (DUF5681)